MSSEPRLEDAAAVKRVIRELEGRQSPPQSRRGIAALFLAELAEIYERWNDGCEPAENIAARDLPRNPTPCGVPVIDISVRDEGTIIVITWVSAEGREWLAEHCERPADWQSLGPTGFATDHRPGWAIVAGAEEAGLTVRVVV